MAKDTHQITHFWHISAKYINQFRLDFILIVFWTGNSVLMEIGVLSCLYIIQWQMTDRWKPCALHIILYFWVALYSGRLLMTAHVSLYCFAFGCCWEWCHSATLNIYEWINGLATCPYKAHYTDIWLRDNTHWVQLYVQTYVKGNTV